MNETFTDGFFYHPDGTIADRIAAGNVNPRLDDIFTLAIKETKSDHAAKVKRLERLEDRRADVDAEIVRAAAEVKRIAVKSREQHEAIAKYQRGEELDDNEQDLLTPKCQNLVGDERKEDVQKAFGQHNDTFDNLEDDGWKVDDKHIKDGFIYVTIKREIVPKTSPEDRVAKKVAKAMAAFFSPEFEREARVQFWNRLGSLSPINPGAG